MTKEKIIGITFPIKNLKIMHKCVIKAMKEVPSIASVIAVGDECTSSLKENDRVIYKEYSGTKVTVDDQDYIVIDEKDIIAKFE